MLLLLRRLQPRLLQPRLPLLPPLPPPLSPALPFPRLLLLLPPQPQPQPRQPRARASPSPAPRGRAQGRPASRRRSRACLSAGTVFSFFRFFKEFFFWKAFFLAFDRFFNLFSSKKTSASRLLSSLFHSYPGQQRPEGGAVPLEEVDVGGKRQRGLDAKLHFFRFFFHSFFFLSGLTILKKEPRLSRREEVKGLAARPFFIRCSRFFSFFCNPAAESIHQRRRISSSRAKARRKDGGTKGRRRRRSRSVRRRVFFPLCCREKRNRATSPSHLPNAFLLLLSSGARLDTAARASRRHEKSAWQG